MSEIPLRVSVIVPTHNRGILICDNIDTLLAQDYESFEILYVNDGSTDETAEILHNYQEYAPKFFRAVHIDNMGPGPARNAGVKLATGDVLLFTDDDVLVPEDWITGMVAAFQQHKRRPVSGRVASYSKKTPVERYLHYRNKISIPASGRTMRATPMMNFMIDRETFNAVGGFLDEPLQAAEDWEFCLRLRSQNIRIAYDGSVPVTHRYQSSIDGAIRRMRATGALGVYIQHRLGAPLFPYVIYAMLRFLVTPLWVPRYFPKDLFWMALYMEWIFITARVKAYGCHLMGRPIPPRGY